MESKPGCVLQYTSEQFLAGVPTKVYPEKLSTAACMLLLNDGAHSRSIVTAVSKVSAINRTHRPRRRGHGA